MFLYQLQCLRFHCRPHSRRSHWPTSLHHRSSQREVAAAFKHLRLTSKFTITTITYLSFNFKSLVAFQAENCETPVSCDNLLRDFLGLRCNVCPISSSFSSVSTWWVLWGFLSRIEPVSQNLFISLRTVSLWGASISALLYKTLFACRNCTWICSVLK